MRSKIICAGLTLVGLVACTTSQAGEPAPDTAEMVEVARSGPEARQEARHRQEYKHLVGQLYVETLAANYVTAVQWDQWWDQAMASWQAAQRSVYSGSSGGGSHSYVGEGDCYASDLPDYIVSRESGGNPNAYNPSGAWGCAQFMPGTWNGSCSDLGAHGSASVEAQNECANRLWNGGAGASHWQATL